MLNQQIDDLIYYQSEHYRDEPNFLVQKLLIREFKKHSQLTDNALFKLAKSVADSEKNHHKKKIVHFYIYSCLIYFLLFQILCVKYMHFLIIDVCASYAF